MSPVNDFPWFVKQNPLAGYTGYGGGPTGLAFGGGAFVADPGQVQWTSSTTWTVPDGVYSVSVVAVGGGSGVNRQAGALSYKNNITVVPGESISVTVGGGGNGNYSNPNGGNSWFKAQNVLFAPGGQHPDHSSSDLVGDGGGVGGASNGGAGGYSAAGNTNQGGAGGRGQCNGYAGGCAGGGGVGLQGQGSPGASSPGSSIGNPIQGGGGGSGGTKGGNISGGYGGNSGGAGGCYGGAGGYSSGSDASGQAGCQGAVRAIWPGDERQFPSTRTGDE